MTHLWINMKKYQCKIIVIFLFFSFFKTSGQGCNYDESIKIVSEICDFYKGNSFSSDIEADKALNRILNATGLPKRFVMFSCSNIDNCLATSYDGIRYILYDKNFMREIAQSTSSWSKISILAHEIGHHVKGHVLDLKNIADGTASLPSLFKSREMELEADEFSGYVMFKLGASLKQAQEVINKIGLEGDDSYNTHPSKNKRLAAIKRGYLKNENVASTIKYQITKAEEYFYLALNSSDDNLNYKIEYYTKAIDLNPNLPMAYFNRGRAFHLSGDFQNAYNDYLKTINLKDDFPDAHNHLGLIYSKDKKYDLAKTCFFRAIQLDNEHGESYHNLSSVYLQERNIDSAILASKEAIKYLEDKAEGYFGLGACIRIKGKIDEALIYLNEAIKLDPLNSKYLKERAYAFISDEIFSKAIDDLTRMVKINPRDDKAYFLRASVKFIAGSKDYCNDFKKACDLGNNNSCKAYLDSCK